MSGADLEPTSSAIVGGGEMGERIRAHDWSATLGPIGTWSDGLCAAVGLVLGSPQPMALWWGDPGVVLYNDAYRAVLGARHPHALGRAPAEVWRDEWPALAPRIEAVRARGESAVEVAGTSSSFGPVRDRTGAVVGVTVVAAGHPERDRRKDEFVAMLAHELRNPLAPIRTALDILALAGGERSLADRARAVMERQLRHLVRLVDDLLDISRLDRGTIELRRERVELAPVVASALEISGPLIAELGHRLTAIPPDQPLVAEVDPTRIIQVVANLLDNAALYMDRGGEIRVGLTRDGDHAVVSVRDRGAGIPPDQRARIFEPFTRLERAACTPRTGLGIGLTIVQRLVGLHGGRVEVDSDGPGRGSEFRVRLPLVASTGARPGAGSSPAHEPPAARRRVLVADDNDEAVETLAELLQLMGNEVEVAHDGVQAVELAARFRPELILLDLGMPRMGGLEACRHIRAQPGGDRVVIAALTGWGHDDDRRRTHEAGFDRHLVKPIGRRALEQLLTAPPRA